MKRRLAGAAAAALLALVAVQAAAAETPRTGTLTGVTRFTVNAGPGDQTDPHVGGNLVTYTNEVSGSSQVRVHDLATGSDVAVPDEDGGLDFLSDTDGTRVTYTHLGDSSAIKTYDPATGAVADVATTPFAQRRESHVGGDTVAWQDFGFSTDIDQPELMVADLATGAVTRLTNDTYLDKDPAVSPDGKLVVWSECVAGFICQVRSASPGADGRWLRSAVTEPSDGDTALPDTDGQTVVYRVVSPAGDDDLGWRKLWWPTRELALPGQQDNPNVSNGVVAFEQLDTTTQVPNYDVWLYDLATNTLYRLTDTPEDETLNDISASGRQVTVVWTKSELDDNVYGERFALPPIPATLSISPKDATAAPGAEVTLTATVKDAEGNPFAGAAVGFYVGGAFGTCTTGADGTCVDTATAPRWPGPYAPEAYLDTNGNGSWDADWEPKVYGSLTVAADATPPSISFDQSPDGTNGWFRTAPASVRVTATDDTAVASLACTLDGALATLDGGAVSVSADGDHVVACTATDDAGNAGTAEAHVKLDATAPTVSVDGFADGQLVLRGSPRPSATCSSGDAGSGIASTTGPTEEDDLTANGVGTVSVTCSATDAAGNTATATRTYRIGYAFGGFQRPVQGAPAVNSGHAGRTYPLKWQLTDGSGGFVSALSAVSSVRYRTVACDSFGGAASEVDATTSGDSGLRYDDGADAYVYTWKTPAAAGCYVLSLALDSGQVAEADFRLG